MSVKHIKRYYKTIKDQYAEMLYCLKEMEKLCETDMVSPEQIESMHESVSILKDNYERWSYMMYLLYMPNKKDKQKKFRQSHHVDGVISYNNTADGVVDENKNVLETLRQNM